MKKGGFGGTNTRTGLQFEKHTDLESALKLKQGVTVRNSIDVFYSDKHVGQLFRKNSFYTVFLHKRQVDWESIVSRKLLPDECYFSLKTGTLFIIEKKYQQVTGSVDEKLQTCGFKRRQYGRLCQSLDVDVEYVYVLNDWFKNERYNDVLGYIVETGCKYYFNQIPYELLGLE